MNPARPLLLTFLFMTSLLSSLLVASTSWAVAPAISAPVVASMSGGNGISITVAGSGFLQGYFPQIIFTGSLNLTITLVDLQNPDPRIRVWTDNQILVDQLPESALRAHVKVKHTSGMSGTFDVGYLYDWFDVYGTGWDAWHWTGHPLAIAFGDSSNRPAVWINQEFHTKFWKFDLLTRKVSTLPVPGAQAIFEFPNTSTGLPEPTPLSAGGEDAQVDQNGDVWFSESGHGEYEPSQSNPVANHSRIVRYNPLTPTALPLEYNVPGDNNRINGFAFDHFDGQERIWFATNARYLDPEHDLVPAIRARLVSFHPWASGDSAGVGSAYDYPFSSSGLTCTNGFCGPGTDISFKQCMTPADCVLAEGICSTTNCDSGPTYGNYFHEYELPPTDTTIGHLLMDDLGGSRSIWYTAYSTRPARAVLGRYNATAGSLKEYPLALPPPPGVNCGQNPSDIRCTASTFGAGPWQLLESPEGDIVLSEHFTNKVARFRTASLGDTNCDSLSPSGANPCIDERVVPTADLGINYVHSLAYDKTGNLWFTLSFASNNSDSLIPTIGFLKPDWTTFVTLPSLSAFSFAAPEAREKIPCNVEAGKNLGVMATGVASDPKLGDIWFGDYCRKRIGRIRDTSSAYSSAWYVITGNDDAYEDNTDTTPSKPKLGATTLKLERSSTAGLKSLAALRLTSQGGASGRALTSHLTLPIVGPAAAQTISLRIYVGTPNDSPLNADLPGDIKARTNNALASIDVNDVQVAAGASSIVLDNQITTLLDIAQRNTAWLPNQTNLVPIYIGRTDTSAFTLSIRAQDGSQGSASLAGARGGL